MATTTKPLWIVIGLLFCTQMLSAADYYWVGGSGNWSDLSHWATTSGGTTRNTQIPTANDRVFFDALSFNGAGQTVTVVTTPAATGQCDVNLYYRILN
jgi:hypothetical protein